MIIKPYDLYGIRQAMYDKSHPYYSIVSPLINFGTSQALDVSWRLWGQEIVDQYSNKVSAYALLIENEMKKARDSQDADYLFFLEMNKAKNEKQVQALKESLQAMLDAAAQDSIAITRSEYQKVIEKIKFDYDEQLAITQNKINEVESKYQNVQFQIAEKEKLIKELEIKRIEAIKEQQRLLNKCNNEIASIRKSLQKSKNEIKSIGQAKAANPALLAVAGAGIVGYFLMNK
jgi:chromosome segregation ATPase